MTTEQQTYTTASGARYTALGRQILLETLPAETMTHSGQIALPKDAQYQESIGRVCAIGPDVPPGLIAVGQLVIFDWQTSAPAAKLPDDFFTVVPEQLQYRYEPPPAAVPAQQSE